MLSLSISIVTSFFINVAHAEPHPQRSLHTLPVSKANQDRTQEKPSLPTDMSHLTMDQQMALCDKIDLLRKQGQTLPSKMQQEEKECQKMDMGQPLSPPSETLDR